MKLPDIAALLLLDHMELDAVPRHNRPAEGQAVERTEVARQNQPVAQPHQKQGPQQGHKPDKAEKNDKDDKDDGKGKKDGKN